MLEQKIDQWISVHCEELLEDIAQLVQIPSISVPSEGSHVYGDACAQALDTMLALGRKYGFETENAGYRFGAIRFGSQEKSIGLWGHLDVVPEGNDWKYPPFACVREGDFLIGRGVQDNKGPCVAALYAMRCIKDLGISLHCRVEQVVGCAEETGMDDVTYYVREYPVPDFNLITDCGFPVCYGEKGILKAELRSQPLSGSVLSVESGSASNIVPDLAVMRLRASAAVLKNLRQLSGEIDTEICGDVVILTAHGIAGHAAFPDGSVNAAAKLCRAVLDAVLLDPDDRAVIEKLEILCASTDGSALSIACRDELSGALTCIAGTVRQQEQRLRVTVNIRYPITADSAEIRRSLAARAEADGWEIAECADNPPNYFDPESPYIRLLTDVYNRVMQTNSKAYVMGGGTYARKIPRAVAFGPGLPTDSSALNLSAGHGGCHAPDELQSITNLQTAIKIYVLALLELSDAMEAELSGKV